MTTTLTVRAPDDMAVQYDRAERDVAQVPPGDRFGRRERAAAAGYGALVLTVDMPVLGYRERDRRSRFDTTDPRRPRQTPLASARRTTGTPVRPSL